MNRTPVKSSHIVSIGHDGRDELEVEFKRNKVYRYHGVPPALYREVLGAESVGAALAAKVIGKFPTNRHNEQDASRGQ